MTDLRAAMEAAAEHLAGKVILLRFKEPPTLGASGECYKTDDGLTCIDIAPRVSDIERVYQILLHETAHARLHVNSVEPTPDHLTTGGAIPRETYPAQVQAVADRSEAEADQLAASWASWAERMTAGYSHISNYVQVIARITALQFYKE